MAKVLIERGFTCAHSVSRGMAAGAGGQECTPFTLGTKERETERQTGPGMGF